MDAVTAEQTADIGRTARWMLLFCTMFGLATMHTLGHAGIQLDGHAHVGTMPAATAAMTDLARLVPAAAIEAPCAGHDCGHHHDHGAMTRWSICLAILGGLAAIVLLTALLLKPVRRRAGTGGTATSEIRTPRPPPRRPVGLTVASTAVLRI